MLLLIRLLRRIAKSGKPSSSYPNGCLGWVRILLVGGYTLNGAAVPTHYCKWAAETPSIPFHFQSSLWRGTAVSRNTWNSILGWAAPAAAPFHAGVRLHICCDDRIWVDWVPCCEIDCVTSNWSLDGKGNLLISTSMSWSPLLLFYFDWWRDAIACTISFEWATCL